MFPSIFVTPLEGLASESEMQSIGEALVNVKPGQVISSVLPVKIYHQINGYWIESADLHRHMEWTKEPFGEYQG